MLSEINKHERDKNVKYNDESHTYRVEYDVIISVSQLVHLHFPEFKKEEIAEKKAKDNNCDISVIYDEWKKLQEAGSTYHKMIENYLNGQTLAVHSGFLDYHNELKKRGWEPYRTEMTIWGNEIAGTVDAIYINKSTNKYLLLDWKHCRKIYKNSFDNTKGHLYMDCLENCNYNHYQLQISVYRYILEKYYNMEIQDAYFVNIFNSKKAYSYKNKDYETFWKPLVEKMLEFVIVNKKGIINHFKK